MTGRSAPPTGTQAVERAAQLMETVLSAREPVTFNQLVDAVDLPKSTTSRLLNALERSGLLNRNQTGAFIAGPLIVQYARRTEGTTDLVAMATPVMELLAKESGETINLAVASHDHVEQIAQIDSTYLLGGTNRIGLPVPFPSSASGKVLLAYGAATLPAGRLERSTARTITSRSELARELDRTRRRGYAVADQELEEGLVALAVPFRGTSTATGATSEDVLGAISLSGPATRLTPEKVAVFGLMLLECSTSLQQVQ